MEAGGGLLYRPGSSGGFGRLFSLMSGAGSPGAHYPLPPSVSWSHQGSGLDFLPATPVPISPKKPSYAKMVKRSTFQPPHHSAVPEKSILKVKRSPQTQPSYVSVGIIEGLFFPKAAKDVADYTQTERLRALDRERADLEARIRGILMEASRIRQELSAAEKKDTIKAKIGLDEPQIFLDITEEEARKGRSKGKSNAAALSSLNSKPSPEIKKKSPLLQANQIAPSLTAKGLTLRAKEATSSKETTPTQAREAAPPPTAKEAVPLPKV
jgi:hypothetical protein